MVGNLWEDQSAKIVINATTDGHSWIRKREIPGPRNTQLAFRHAEKKELLYERMFVQNNFEAWYGAVGKRLKSNVESCIGGMPPALSESTQRIDRIDETNGWCVLCKMKSMKFLAIRVHIANIIIPMFVAFVAFYMYN